MNSKDFKFSIKATAEGTFEGLAAVYGNLDLGGDIIAPGAFTKTIKEKDGRVPILWQHDAHEPIGMGEISDSEDGLEVHGELVMESPVAQKAFALMKKAVLRGLSIGYDTVVSTWDKAREVRTLNEIKLWEISLVTFPMNPEAQVSTVKEIAEDIDELVSMLVGRSKRIHEEFKAGRMLSAATRGHISASYDAMGTAMSHLSALMEAGAVDEFDNTPVDKSAANLNAGPENLHPAFERLREILSRGIPAHH